MTLKQTDKEQGDNWNRGSVHTDFWKKQAL